MAVEIKRTKNGYLIEPTISQNGTVTMPVAISRLVGKGKGDRIKLIVLENQG